MLKKIFIYSIILSGLIVPAIGESVYEIHLKNGGQISTPLYWEENQEFRFYVSGGVMGIEKDMVKRIKKCTIDRTKVSEDKTSPEKTFVEAEKDLSPPKPPGQFDMKAHQDKMAKLKADLNKTLTRLRKASTSKDLAAKDEATADNRKISAEMWKLTDELKAMNNGKLPIDWWEGVGRE